MKQYKDLAIGEKRLFNKIESEFLERSITLKSFVRVLGVLINKYKKVKQ